MTELLLYTFIYLSFAVLTVIISQRAGLGSVLGYLLAGIAIGPVLGFVGKETESIGHVAEFGVVMMLFIVGLELAPKMLWQMRHKLIGLGGLQVSLSLFGVMVVAMLMGLPWQIGVALGCILSLSSTAIVLQTFAEKKLMNTQGGQSGFAVLLFQDVAAIISSVPDWPANSRVSAAWANGKPNNSRHTPARQERDRAMVMGISLGQKMQRRDSSRFARDA